ncbi:MAG: hypothetical protein ACM3U1_06000 [Chloroflexota bacterium]
MKIAYFVILALILITPKLLCNGDTSEILKSNAIKTPSGKAEDGFIHFVNGTKYRAAEIEVYDNYVAFLNVDSNKYQTISNKYFVKVEDIRGSYWGTGLLIGRILGATSIFPIYGLNIPRQTLIRLTIPLDLKLNISAALGCRNNAQYK